MSATVTDCKPYAPDRAAGPVTTRLAPPQQFNEQQRAAALFTPADDARLRRLEAAIADDDERARRFRDAREEEEMLLMRRPLTTERAYALFGLLLGVLPPAAIVFRFAAFAVLRESDLWFLFFVLLFGLPMTALCALTGRRMGRRLAPMMERGGRRHWLMTLFYAVAAGFAWACATGAAGGAVVFLIGAFYGLLCALPFGLAGFLLFAVCHCLLARGGMIDARHFWPVACGIALVSAAVILSPGLIPY